MANLLTNALTANPSDRPVRLDGRLAGARLHLRVIDHGAGLPADDRDRLFAPFQRLDDHGGTCLGLGLAIARGFTEAIDGTLAPFRHARWRTDHDDQHSGGIVIRVLIVDDDHSLLQPLRVNLTARGYHVHVAAYAATDLAVPAWLLLTVNTAGSVGAISRAITVCSRATIMAASTTGSTEACGIDPCAPRP